MKQQNLMLLGIAAIIVIGVIFLNMERTENDTQALFLFGKQVAPVKNPYLAIGTESYILQLCAEKKIDYVYSKSVDKKDYLAALQSSATLSGAIIPTLPLFCGMSSNADTAKFSAKCTNYGFDLMEKNCATLPPTQPGCQDNYRCIKSGSMGSILQRVKACPLSPPSAEYATCGSSCKVGTTGTQASLCKFGPI